MTPRHFKCSQFRKSNLDYNFECTKLLQIDFRKQRYITLNATIPGQDRIYPKTHLCGTFLLSIYEAILWLLKIDRDENRKLLTYVANAFTIQNIL